MFEAEYARRRTTAEAEAGRICSGDTVCLLYTSAGQADAAGGGGDQSDLVFEFFHAYSPFQTD